MPVGALIFLSKGVYIARGGSCGVYIVKSTNRQDQNSDIENWAILFWHYSIYKTKLSIYTISNKTFVHNNVPKKL